jgi:hypothetical protein
MDSRSHLFYNLISWTTSILIFYPTFAAPKTIDSLNLYNERIQIGWELELGNSQIANLFRKNTFDLDYFEDAVRKNLNKIALPPDFLDNYLENEGALESLPQNIKNKLLTSDINIVNSQQRLPLHSQATLPPLA